MAQGKWKFLANRYHCWSCGNFPRTCWSNSNRLGFDVSTGCGFIKRDWIVKNSLNNLINSVGKLWYFIRHFIESLNFFNFLRKHFLVYEKRQKGKPKAKKKSSTSFEYGKANKFSQEASSTESQLQTPLLTSLLWRKIFLFQFQVKTWLNVNCFVRECALPLKKKP